MKKYTVYLIRHISTGMVLYVGKTDNLKRRAYEHLTLNSNSKKWLSVIGTGNVLIEEVAKFDNEVDALKYEDELILKYGTIENGYNGQRSGLITENPEEYNKKYQKKYREIDEHKEHMREYKRKWQKEYSKTDKFKEYQRKWHREYSKTDKCREYQRDYHKKYEKTDKRIEYQKEYRNSEKYKEHRREYDRDRYQAKKMGITIDNYRKFKQNKKQPIQLTINFD